MGKMYQDGEYFKKNPTWNVEDSPWKAEQIIKMINFHGLEPKSICEIGCGAGEILNQLYYRLPNNISFYGYEISPQAFEICKERKKERMTFFLRDFQKDEEYFDLILIIDVIEHIDNYIGFLKKIRNRGKYKIFHIPLDLSVQTLLRNNPILKSIRDVGHIHYFTKDIAIFTLKETGYEIIDYFYTPAQIELPDRGFKAALLKWPRRIFFSINKDLAVRILGGFEFLVLTK